MNGLMVRVDGTLASASMPGAAGEQVILVERRYSGALARVVSYELRLDIPEKETTVKLTAISISTIALVWAVSGHSQPASSKTAKESPKELQIAVSSNEGARNFQARWGYAPAVRSGDYIHLSGVIAGPPDSTDISPEAFKTSLRGTFTSLSETLASLDASLADVVRINTYHVFDSPYFDGDKMAHMEAVRDIKAEFMGAATPAWTAIGVSELFVDNGLVEIELTVYAP